MYIVGSSLKNRQVFKPIDGVVGIKKILNFYSPTIFFYLFRLLIQKYILQILTSLQYQPSIFLMRFHDDFCRKKSHYSFLGFVNFQDIVNSDS